MHKVQAKGILSAQNGMNIYRGCQHGCIYCDARSKCYQMNHAFEDIEVKENAPELLEKVLKSKRKKCMIGTGAMSDPYIPLEEQLGLTKKCLEIIAHYGFGLAIQTKSDRILRDLELLKTINHKAKCVVQMTLTTYDEGLCRIVEPNVCTTAERVKVLEIMKEEGIPTVVWMSPLLPFLNDTEENIRGLMDYCIKTGVKGIICFDMGMTLREGDREYYYHMLERHFPGMKDKYVRLYGKAYEIPSPRNRKLMAIFREISRKHGILSDVSQIFSYLHEFEDKSDYQQISLFD